MPKKKRDGRKSKVPSVRFTETKKPPELVNHPEHYNLHPSGVECIDVIEHMPLNVGQVFKYLWRAGLKKSEPTPRDYNKALWYLLREMYRKDIAVTVEGVTLDGVESVVRRTEVEDA